MYFLLSYLYRFIIFIRFWCYDKNLFKKFKFSVPIISIGNISVGGTGKTPMTIYLAKILTENKIKHVIISRGYKKKIYGTVVVSDGKGDVIKSSKEGGDEPLLMAHVLPKTPIISGERKNLAIDLAIQLFNPKIILLDDGLQSHYITKNVDIALFNCLHPQNKFHLLPYGTLRELPSALLRSQIVIFTKYNLMEHYQYKSFPFTQVVAFLRANNHPFIFANYDSYYQEYSIDKNRLLSKHYFLKDGKNTIKESLKSMSVYAISGVGDSLSFNLLCKQYFKNIIKIINYPDHHHYSQLRPFLEQQFNNIDCDPGALVTTYKDLIKFQDDDNSILRWLKNKNIRVLVIGIEINLPDSQQLIQMIKNLVP